MEDIILAGFGGHARSVIDSIEMAGEYHIVGYTDFSEDLRYKDYPWLGTDEKLAYYFREGINNACITVGYMGTGKVRDQIYKLVKKIGFRLPVIKDPSAVIGRDAVIGEGSYIGKNAVVNSGAKVGKMTIINTGAVVEHENRIGDFSHISVGITLCGDVTVSDHCFIGANSTIIQGKEIGRMVTIGAGSVILCDIQPEQMVYGIVNNSVHGWAKDKVLLDGLVKWIAGLPVVYALVHGIYSELQCT